MDFLMAAQVGLHVHWSWGKEGVPSNGGRTHGNNRARNGCAGDASVTALPENMI